ncbi:MAG TPA: hypothetical protein VN279_09140, partial [Rhodocyclaceae bacterium]|nr:hypothetical protein [Rhodocyclaceae bacterium]
TLDLAGKVPGALCPTTLGLLRTLGSYPWSKNLFVIHAARPSPAVRAFVDFLRGPAAREAMRRADYLPAAHAR